MANRILFATVLLLLLDLYSFQAFKTAFSGDIRVTRIFWSFSFLVLLTLVTAQLSDYSQWPKVVRIYWTAIIFIIYISKLFIVLFMSVDDLLRLFKWVANFFVKAPAGEKAAFNLSRSAFLSKAALITAAIPLGLFIRGMITGLDGFKVRKVRIALKKLPRNFEGLKIVQISDIHVGTYMSTAPLEKAVSIIQKLKPDVVFFTGDLVNNLASEMEGYVDTLKKVQAPLGVYSVLGNHDYGDYHTWGSEGEKLSNLDTLKSVHAAMGWRLLLNENTEIAIGEEKISLIGLENWGGRGFQKYGDMKKATRGLPDNPVTLLLSHDPSHWTLEVSEKYPSVDLTFSGHTHGMQFGVDNKWIQWSPVKYFYRHWAGLYTKGSQYLYVNRGLGCIGYPGRVGILPEISLIELYKS